MKYPNLQEIPSNRNMVDVFGGYNHNIRIGEGEFYDMKNLSSDNYPVLSPRQKRGVYLALGNSGKPRGVIAKGGMWHVEAPKIIKDKGVMEFDLGLSATTKTMVSIGSYIIILPDKKYVNTVADRYGKYDYGDIEVSLKGISSATVNLCEEDGTPLTLYTMGATEFDVYVQKIAPQEPSSENTPQYWIDTSENPNVLKKYYTEQKGWFTVKSYVSIDMSGITMESGGIFVGDGITIKGVSKYIDGDKAVKSISGNGGGAVGKIVVEGITSKVFEAKNFSVERLMPKMDFIIESQNRLWGCRYGKNANGDFVNEIYASKLGDFRNWYCYEGVSTDSYTASVGTDGAFTGAISHMGYPLFFKENALHKVYGNYPANYQIQTTACRGVQSGCGKSLAIVNEVLYYKSRSGVCAYDGSLPVEISSALGEESYSNASAGALGNKYYISMKDTKGAYHFFAYDTKKGMWHREDSTQATEFCPHDGDLYYIEYDLNRIMTVKGTGTVDTAPIQWEAVTGILGTESPDKKYISRIDVRMSLTVGTRVMFFAEYDSSGEWEYLFAVDGVSLRSFSIPVKPKRCDHMRLKIMGVGDAKIFSICKTTEKGSEL